MKEKRRNYGSNQLIAWIHAFYDIIYKFKKILIKTFTGCPTLLETVNLELKFSLMVGVMVVKFSVLLVMYIGFNVHLSKMG